MASKGKENAEKLKDEFALLRSNALNRGVNDKQLGDIIKNRKSPETKVQRSSVDPAHRLHVLVLLLAVSVGLVVGGYKLIFAHMVTSPCMVKKCKIGNEIFRPRVNCSMCRDIFHATEAWNLSAEEFQEKYAFSIRPVLVKEAISNWTAMSHFSFKFFQKLYRETSGSLESVKMDQMFYPYETEFVSLADALNMSDERGAYLPGQKPWYFGWGTRHPEMRKKLRQYYQRPYFLPDDSETVAEDWIFMGGPGPGADMHLDYVKRPSWQAQIAGTKTWQVIPTPECEDVCHSFNITVRKGDIIVLDTNNWYHATFIHPGEVSICIGSEFD
ncbi:uncharacterized protein LOC143292892 [Babylonia areolata]|uniref:uncharacterized protein LOC143292892 n=1 Tax=Babylonia areolata TaxID=304850 RepID=UPI003FD47EFF